MFYKVVTAEYTGSYSHSFGFQSNCRIFPLNTILKNNLQRLLRCYNCYNGATMQQLLQCYDCIDATATIAAMLRCYMIATIQCYILIQCYIDTMLHWYDATIIGCILILVSLIGGKAPIPPSTLFVFSMGGKPPILPFS